MSNFAHTLSRKFRRKPPDVKKIKPCPACGERHTMDEPHAMSWRYRVWFAKNFKRTPDYNDACAHLDKEGQKRYREAVRWVYGEQELRWFK